MSENIKLLLKKDYVEVEIEEDGMTHRKNVAYNSLATLFTQQTEVYTSPLLPGEYGIQKIKESNTTLKILYLEPPRLVDVRYGYRYKPTFREKYFTEEEWDLTREEDETDQDFLERKKERFDELVTSRRNMLDGQYLHRYKFVSPRLLWYFDLQKRTDGRGFNVREEKVYAMKSSILTTHERLYRAPFANVYSSNGICWGDRRPSIPTIKAIQGISTVFFNAPFNTDLDSNRLHYMEYETFDGTPKEGSMFFNLLEASSIRLENGESFEEVLQFTENLLYGEGYDKVESLTERF